MPAGHAVTSAVVASEVTHAGHSGFYHRQSPEDILLLFYLFIFLTPVLNSRGKKKLRYAI